MCSYFMDGESTIEEAWLQVVSFFVFFFGAMQVVRWYEPFCLWNERAWREEGC
jgi:hypothetical protein